jgi:hypothetical protein
MDIVFLLSEKGEAGGDAGAGRVGCKLIAMLETMVKKFREGRLSRNICFVVVTCGEPKCDSRQQDQFRLDRGGTEGAWLALIIWPLLWC